jgi:hypothetical protein
LAESRLAALSADDEYKYKCAGYAARAKSVVLPAALKGSQLEQALPGFPPPLKSGIVAFSPE